MGAKILLKMMMMIMMASLIFMISIVQTNVHELRKQVLMLMRMVVLIHRKIQTEMVCMITYLDTDNDRIGNNADLDDDGIFSNADICPDTPQRWTANSSGCAVIQQPIAWTSATSLSGLMDVKEIQ